MKKTLAVLLSLLLTLSASVALTGTAGAIGDTIGQYDYTITNPYAAVDWDTWQAYKNATHVHTVRSDGNVELDDMIEAYYALGYQGLALTDHGTVNYSWTKDQTRLSIFGYQYFVHGNIDEISEARYRQITTGADRGGNGMIEIPLGIELNGASTVKCHVNSYFADVGHGDLGINEDWPENAIRKSQNGGAICHINHVGEWTDGKDDIGTYDSAFVSRFANLFLNYPACVGMELVNTSDNRTHNDRYLYDEALRITTARGRNIFGFCEDDAHDLDDCGRNAQYFVMPANTAANVRTAMETGAFYACSKNAKTAAELGNGFTAQGEFPMVSRITVDEATDQITICATNGNVIKMVAGGAVLAQKAIGADNAAVTFDLNDYENAIGTYVRFYITGPGGICYIQPFMLTKAAYNTCTVQFRLPTSDTALQVRDANGTLLPRVNGNDYYILPAGNYTYTASKQGYTTKTEHFTVTDADIALGRQIKLDVTLSPDVGAVSVCFYVPETIYLTPGGNTFRYYLDRANAVDGALTADAQDTAGNIFFYCNEAQSVTVRAQNVTTATCGSIDFKTGYTVVGNTVSTAVTAGSAPAGTVIRWTADYTLPGGETRTAYTFSYVYVPVTDEVAAGIRQVHTYSTDVYNQGILYMIGVHRISGGSSSCTKNFFTDTAPTKNTGIANWFTASADGGSVFGNYKHTSNAADTHSVTSGTGTVYVDSARVTNLDQIPNLQIGFWQCDIEGDSAVTGSVTQTVDNNTTTLATLRAGLGKIYDGKIRFANAKNCTGSKSVTTTVYTQTLRGLRKNNNYYNVVLNVQYISKDALRTAYNNVIRATGGMQTVPADVIAALQAAGTVLGDPLATAAQIQSAVQTLNALQ